MRKTFWMQFYIKMGSYYLEGEFFSPFSLNFQSTAKNQGTKSATPLNFVWVCYHGLKVPLHSIFGDPTCQKIGGENSPGLIRKFFYFLSTTTTTFKKSLISKWFSITAGTYDACFLPGNYHSKTPLNVRKETNFS